MRYESEHPDNTATSDESSPDTQEEPYETPILVDVHRDGFQLVGLEEGLSPSDAVYPALLLWRDRNHDGVSQATELRGLSIEGILGIDLDPVVLGRRDRHGNLLRWASQVDFANGSGLAAIDVVFLSGDVGADP